MERAKNLIDSGRSGQVGEARVFSYPISNFNTKRVKLDT